MKFYNVRSDLFGSRSVSKPFIWIRILKKLWILMDRDVQDCLEGPPLGAEEGGEGAPRHLLHDDLEVARLRQGAQVLHNVPATQK